MDATWTLNELVAEVEAHLAALPPPKNGQVRPVPDERTVRYYGTIGLLDRPVATRGRTALYGRRHVAQVVAIKRLQSAGRSLDEIRGLWPTLDDATLSRMSGVALGVRPTPAGFWKVPPASSGASRGALAARPDAATSRRVPAAVSVVEHRLELAPGCVIAVSLAPGRSLSADDVRALRAAARPLLTELAHRQLAPQDEQETP